MPVKNKMRHEANSNIARLMREHGFKRHEVTNEYTMFVKDSVSVKTMRQSRWVLFPAGVEGTGANALAEQLEPASPAIPDR